MSSNSPGTVCPYTSTKKTLNDVINRFISRIENNPRKELLALLLEDIENLRKFPSIAIKYDIPTKISKKELRDSLSQGIGLPERLRITGAMMAWLNTGKCPGRGFAGGGLDHREFLDENISHQKVFDAVVDHLRYGLKGKPSNQAITLFSPGVTIHNPIMLTFAGYSNGIGQQNNIALTKNCMDLGRQPLDDKSNFTILPLLIEINNEILFFEYPQDLTKTISIISKKYSNLVELGLKRSQMPSQSAKLNLGSETFTAVINGPRTIAEIVEMNLLNENKFPHLKDKISESLGIDKKDYPQTFDMEVALKLAEAVYHSYKQVGANALIGDNQLDGSIEGFHNQVKVSGIDIPENFVYMTGAMLNSHNTKSYNNAAILAKMGDSPSKGSFFTF